MQSLSMGHDTCTYWSEIPEPSNMFSTWSKPVCIGSSMYFKAFASVVRQKCTQKRWWCSFNSRSHHLITKTLFIWLWKWLICFWRLIVKTSVPKMNYSAIYSWVQTIISSYQIEWIIIHSTLGPCGPGGPGGPTIPCWIQNNNSHTAHLNLQLAI